MNTSTKHVWVTGECAAVRLQAMAALPPADVSVSCHRLLRGPYTGVSSVLADLVPRIQRQWPDLVWAHRFAILTVAPQLEDVIGPVEKNLTMSSTGEERTRYQGGLGRRASHGVTELLVSYAVRRDQGPLVLNFDAVDAADFTDQEFLAILLRRAAPDQVHVRIGAAPSTLPDELVSALQAHTDPKHVPGAEPPPVRGDDELLHAFIESGGTSDDPAERDAWLRADAGRRAALHDAQADRLIRTGDFGHRLGAVPYHLEHGSDPGGAGVAAFEVAVNHCIGNGLYEAARELATRACAITDPVRQHREYCLFVAKMALSISPTEPDQAEKMLNDLRRRYPYPKVHMSTSYSIAMLYTKFYPPARRDHAVAKAFAQNGIAIASSTPNPQDRAFYTAFHRNGLALIELNTGNLTEALRLVTSGIELLEQELPADKHQLHHSVLFHNRARLHQALGMFDEAKRDFDRAIELDPNFSEYLYDRGSLARLRGDADAAIADYEKAMSLSAPYPEAYYSRGDTRASNGDTTGALADFDYVLELEPDHVDALINRAALLLESGDVDRAAADVQRGLGLAPDSAHLLCAQGLIALETGDHPAARTSFQAALAVDPAMHAALVNHAVLDYEEGDFDAAVEKLTGALDHVNDDPDLWFNRGVAHQAAERYAAAIDDYTAALALPGADRAELQRQSDLCRTAMGTPLTPAGTQ
ncbi:hypothetical protein ALI144C_07320 [Actinosynnema sp. ALI-1.44]|uniref:tetratricopeptide repeat protein n=1 Tax=Actinosynnema sp. ALI-1.44 TaxID=1933779 RepID=UPI00097CBE41|nr:tetratricopeptide repeat protein [Actinosynnema sp. ALI-1.44]ONI88249.1 hypothetical protein ALI144C_07320 [Actinosynnema sp. ALI-1.44]